MKKNLKKKLRLNRETLALLESKVVAGGYVTSCTYPCDCPTGCTENEPCLGTGVETAANA
jgi:hypothetical protein